MTYNHLMAHMAVICLQGDIKSPLEYIQEAEPIKVSGPAVASYGSELTCNRPVARIVYISPPTVQPYAVACRGVCQQGVLCRACSSSDQVELECVAAHSALWSYELLLSQRSVDCSIVYTVFCGYGLNR